MFFIQQGDAVIWIFSLWQYFYETLLSKRQKGVCILIVKEQLILVDK